MSSRPRFLTKSRHKMALECATKLFFTGKPREYADASIDDPFLMALARGGFQVGALAKCYYPKGIEVSAKSHDESLKETADLLRQENVTIFEAAIRFENLFIRVDILEKVGNRIRLIEVKAKSFDKTEDDPFFDKRLYAKKRIKIKEKYASYLYDVAFQTHVIRSAFPDFEVSSYLMLTDKTATTSVDGLNQLFLLRRSADGRSVVETQPGISEERLGQRILCEVNVDEAVRAILSDQDEGRPAVSRVGNLPFSDEVRHLAAMYADDKKIQSTPGKQCRDCEFGPALQA